MPKSTSEVFLDKIFILNEKRNGKQLCDQYFLLEIAHIHCLILIQILILVRNYTYAIVQISQLK